MSGTFPGTPVKNCDKARDAFASRDATASKIEHAKKITSTLEPWSEKTPDTVRVLYMSGIEGVSLTLAVVASAAGIGDGASWPTVVVIAAVVVVATGLASGFGEFVNSMGELLLARWEREREAWEVENDIDGERREMVAIYMARGYPEHDAKLMTEIVSRDNKRFVDVMMVDELGILPEFEDSKRPRNLSFVRSISFIFFGLLPVCAAHLAAFGLTCGFGADPAAGAKVMQETRIYLLMEDPSAPHAHLGLVTVATALLALLVLGFVKARCTRTRARYMTLLTVVQGLIVVVVCFYGTRFLLSHTSALFAKATQKLGTA